MIKRGKIRVNPLPKKGFMLIELLIVIAILVILALILIFALNPLELFRQGRDGKRLAEVSLINSAINLAIVMRPNIVLGTPQTVYLSLPDSNPNCGSYDLPRLRTGWSYACKPESDYRRIDGNGWLPIDFENLPSSPLSVLPIDPINKNEQGRYYSYATGGSWELNAVLGSIKYQAGGSQDAASTDGGTTKLLYEKGTNLTLIPSEIDDRQGQRVPPSCKDGQWIFTGGNFWETYTPWVIPGFGVAKISRIWLWQLDNTLTPDEAVQMAIYEGTPGGGKLSDETVINGTGMPGEWISGELASPLEITRGDTYIFGQAPAPGVDSYVTARDIGADCLDYLPNTQSYYDSTGASDFVLNSSVPTTPTTSGHYFIIGVTFVP